MSRPGEDLAEISAASKPSQSTDSPITKTGLTRAEAKVVQPFVNACCARKRGMKLDFLNKAQAILSFFTIDICDILDAFKTYKKFEKAEENFNDKLSEWKQFYDNFKHFQKLAAAMSIIWITDSIDMSKKLELLSNKANEIYKFMESNEKFKVIVVPLKTKADSVCKNIKDAHSKGYFRLMDKYFVDYVLDNFEQWYALKKLSETKNCLQETSKEATVIKEDTPKNSFGKFVQSIGEKIHQKDQNTQEHPSGAYALHFPECHLNFFCRQIGSIQVLACYREQFDALMVKNQMAKSTCVDKNPGDNDPNPNKE